MTSDAPAPGLESTTTTITTRPRGRRSPPPAEADGEANPGRRSSSQLSLDDLSSHGDKGADETHEDDEEGGTAEAFRASGTQGSASALETQLQSNLKQQQEHYARQRRLFDELRRETALPGPAAAVTPSQFSSSSKSEDDASGTSSIDAIRARSRRFELQLQEMQQELAGGDMTPTISRPRPKCTHQGRPSRLIPSPEGDGETDAIASSRRAKDVADRHSHVTLPRNGGVMSRGPHIPSRQLKMATSRGVEHHLFGDTSNEALRKQLELLRRLQVENNRFRNDNRSLREQNELLEEQTALQSREISRLREEIEELARRVQHDQLQLATAAQTARRLKQTQKQTTALQGEKEQLSLVLQEATDQHQQFKLKAQGEIEMLVQESKHLKRTIKQLKQHDASLKEEVTGLSATLAKLEDEKIGLKRDLVITHREKENLEKKLSEQGTQIQNIQSSATECVERMEAGMEALQKSHSTERDKRRKLEKQLDVQQNQVSEIETDRRLLQERVQDLEQANSRLQQRLQELKTERKQEKKGLESKVSEMCDRHQSDAKTIIGLREECTSLEQQLESTRTSIVDLRKEVANESNGLRKELESLRNYIEDATCVPLQQPSILLDEATPNPAHSSSLPIRQRREDLWVQLPELQYVHGAVGGLRNEIMNFVNEFHRARHVTRQQGNKLSQSEAKIVELEHLRGEDAVTMEELRNQRALSEEARDITVKEKLEIIKWSQQTCEKNELLESELKKCEHQLNVLVDKMKRQLSGTDDIDTVRHREIDDGVEVAHRMVSKLVTVAERAFHELTARFDLTHDQLQATTRQNDDQKDKIARLQRELEAKVHEFQETVVEIEALHSRNVAEKQQLVDEALSEMEHEKATMAERLLSSERSCSTLRGETEALKAKVQKFSEDVPVLTAIVQVFSLVIQPLLLQLSDLRTQKRFLLRENAQLHHTQGQIECIGQVLKELLPTGGVRDAISSNHSRRRKFRRVVVAVFAMNRFQRYRRAANHPALGESIFGIPSSLMPITKKKRALPNSGRQGPRNLIVKVLPPKLTLAQFQLDKIVTRAKQHNLVEAIVQALESPAAGEDLGVVLLQSIAVIDPAKKELIMENMDGGFHCQVLLERRKADRRGHSLSVNDKDNIDDFIEDCPTVDLIRKKILLLGKRVEDLHYQRNALQKENYELQFQAEQQRAQLTEMDTCVKTIEELKHAITNLNCSHEQTMAQQHQQTETFVLELQQKDKELEKHKSTISQLECDLQRLQELLENLNQEKSQLLTNLDTLQAASVEEEEKLLKSRIILDKQAEEVRILKQAAKRAHDLQQKAAWQLEQEVMEKANLHAIINHLRKQKEILESEVHKVKLRVLDSSIDSDTDRVPTNAISNVIIEDESCSNATKTNGAKSLSPAYKRTALLGVDEDCDALAKRLANLAGGSFNVNVNEKDNANESRDEERNEVFYQRRHRDIETLSQSFRNEWERLDISSIFDDHQTGKSGEDVCKENDKEMNRRTEVDKVNTAVHDYMDRIDQKLQQVYGIPRSGSRVQAPEGENESPAFGARQFMGKVPSSIPREIIKTSELRRSGSP